MAFFDLPTDEEILPDARSMLAEYQRMLGHREVPVGWRAFADLSRVIQARLVGHRALFHQCSFPWEIKNLAWMLIAHAKRCGICFTYSRGELDRLGWDEATLNQACANPQDLPLKDRDRAFVQYTLKTALDPAGLKLQDFKEMEASGLSKAEILELLAFAAYANMQMTFTLSQVAWLTED